MIDDEQGKVWVPTCFRFTWHFPIMIYQVSVQLIYLIYKYSIFNIDTCFLVGKERLKYLIGTNFRGHLISRKKGRHISLVFTFAIWAQNYFLPESIFAKLFR